MAPAETTVLLLGESGTGKEVAARALHRNSRRAEKAFVAVNCATLGDNLLESELFGHEKGAFTGAVGLKKGLLETADGGTVDNAGLEALLGVWTAGQRKSCNVEIVNFAASAGKSSIMRSLDQLLRKCGRFLVKSIVTDPGSLLSL